MGDAGQGQDEEESSRAEVEEGFDGMVVVGDDWAVFGVVSLLGEAVGVRAEGGFGRTLAELPRMSREGGDEGLESVAG